MTIKTLNRIATFGGFDLFEQIGKGGARYIRVEDPEGTGMLIPWGDFFELIKQIEDTPAVEGKSC